MRKMNKKRKVVEDKKKTKGNKKKKKKAPRVRAVGFSAYNPMAIVVFSAYSKNPNAKIYNIADEENMQRIKKEDNNYLIVTSTSHLPKVREYASLVDTVLLFDTTKELTKLGLPILDVEVDENGKYVQIPEQTIDTLRDRIEQEAVTLLLKKKGPVVKKSERKERPKKKEKSAASNKVNTDQSLVSFLQKYKAEFSGSGSDFDNLFVIPSCLYIASEFSSSEFTEICDAIQDHGFTKAHSKEMKTFISAKKKILKEAVSAIKRKSKPQDYAQKVATAFQVPADDIVLIAKVLDAVR